MKRERAIELLRWGPYAKPAPTPKEMHEALGMLAQDKTLRPYLSWPDRPERKKT